MRRPTERRWVPWLNGVRRTTSHSTSTRPRSWWWITGDRAENTHPSPSTRHLWSGLTALSSSAFTSPRISHGLLTQMQCWRRHISASSSWDGWGSLERAPESSDPSTPALWRASWPAVSQHRWQPQGSAKGRANCPPHCWRWASLPPGYLHQAVHEKSPEDHQRLQPPVPQSALAAALRKTSPQHPIPHEPTEGQLFLSGYQANEQSEIIHPAAHPHFTVCHALHFNFYTVQLDYTHTLHQKIWWF